MPFPKYAVSSFKGPFVYSQEETQDSWKPEGIWGEWDYSAGWIQRQAGPSLPELWSCFVSRPSPHPLNTFTDKLSRSHRVVWLWVRQWGDLSPQCLAWCFCPRPGVPAVLYSEQAVSIWSSRVAKSSMPPFWSSQHLYILKARASFKARWPGIWPRNAD